MENGIFGLMDPGIIKAHLTKTLWFQIYVQNATLFLLSCLGQAPPLCLASSFAPKSYYLNRLYSKFA
jgi:hypothetical protein